MLLGALFLLLLPVVSQTPRPPLLYVHYALPGDTAYAWLSIVIDSPLTLTRDSSGQAHLSLDAGAILGGCSVGGANHDEMLCAGYRSSFQGPGAMQLQSNPSASFIGIQANPGMSQTFTLIMPVNPPPDGAVIQFSLDPGSGKFIGSWKVQ